MKSLTLRSQVVVWFVGLTIVILAVAARAMYLETRDHLSAALDQGMAATATTLVALSDWDEHAEAVEFELDEDLAARMAASRPGSSEEILTWPARAPVHARGPALLAPLPEPDWAADADLRAREWVEYTTAERPSGQGADLLDARLHPA